MLSLLQPRFTDDRGQPVELWSPASLDRAQLARGESDIPAPVMDRILSAWNDPRNSLMRAPFNRESRPFLLIGIPLFLFYILGVAVLVPMFGGSSLALGCVIFVFIVTANWLHNRWKKFRLGRAVREPLIAERICASCAYQLDGIPAEPDGCTTCPECHAAWKLTLNFSLSGTPAAWSPPRDSSTGERSRLLRLLTMGALGRPRVLAMLDDAGRLVELVHSPAAAAQTPGWSAIDPELQRTLTARLRWYGWWRRVLLGLGAILYASLAAITLRRAMRFTPTLSVGYLIHVFPVFLCSWWTLWMIGLMIRPPTRNRRKYANILLARQLCACCTTDLSTAPRASDAAALCPVCHATWKLPAAPADSPTPRA